MKTEKSKKIALVINTLALGGGAERAAAAVADGLKANGHQVAFLLFDDSARGYETEADVFLMGDGRAPDSSFSALFFILKRGKAIADFCKENGIDTCIGFMEEANFALVASKVFFGNKAKIICGLRNNPERKKPAARFLIKVLYRWADLVVANSSALAEIARRGFGLKRIKVVYNSVAYGRIADLQERPLPREWVEVFAGGKTFLNIGRLTAQKDQTTLIKAFKIVLEKEPLAKLAIIGEGSLRSDLEKLTVDLGLSKNVFFLGRQENVFPFLKASSVFVLSSLWEGLPNSVLEALALGLPVVSTDCPTGPREIIIPENNGNELPLESERGILVEPGDEKMLAMAMLKLLTKPKKEIVDERFRLENILIKWRQIL